MKITKCYNIILKQLVKFIKHKSSLYYKKEDYNSNGGITFNFMKNPSYKLLRGINLYG